MRHALCYECAVPPATDLAVPLDDLLIRLIRTSRSSSYRARILDGVAGIPSIETLRVLRSIERFEQRGQRPSIRDVGLDLEIEQSTASRAVNAVVDRGLAARTADASDLRRALLSLTSSGRAELFRATSNRLGLVAEVVSEWPAADLTTFVGLLERFVGAYEHVRPS